MHTRYEKFEQLLENMLEWQEEYETKHDDAGSNYSHLIGESNITADDVNRRSEHYNYPNKHLLTDNELADIIENGDFEMVPGSIFIPSMGENQYYLDSFCVGEIEMQLEFSMFEELGITEASFHRCMRLADKSRKFCLRETKYGTAYGPGTIVWYAYINTDAVWYAIHTRTTNEEQEVNK